jgi:nicotinate-nucleotide adenylyltransferase
VCATQARWQLGLERVVLMPAGVPPHKAAPDDPGAEHRLAMCRLAAADEASWLEVSDREVRRAGPSYTIDTLREINADDPGDQLTFIVGGDMAWSLPAWREPEAVLELATLAIAERAGTPRDDVAARLASLRGGDRLAFIDMPRIDITSSGVRVNVRAGRPIRYLVPDRVVDYIAEKGLYA